MKKAKDLRDLSIEELEFARDETRKELFNLRNDMRSRKDQKRHLLPQKRKEIARLMTIIHEKTVVNQ